VFSYEIYFQLKHLTILRLYCKFTSLQGAAFGFSTIAAQAGAQLAPYMSQIVPRLYRYTFDPNVKIQTAMRAIWNAVVKETKPTVSHHNFRFILFHVYGALQGYHAL